jgi:hypothetical protein
MKIRPAGAELFHVKTNGEAELMKFTVAFIIFVNATDYNCWTLGLESKSKIM